MSRLRSPSVTARTRPNWVYLADRARAVEGLSTTQICYAQTLRGVLARHLLHEVAQRRRTVPAGAAAREWLGIHRACQREMRRMERAQRRLAAASVAADGAA